MFSCNQIGPLFHISSMWSSSLTSAEFYMILRSQRKNTSMSSHMIPELKRKFWSNNGTSNSCSYSEAHRRLCTLRGPHSTLDLLAISEMPHCAGGSPSKAPMLGQVGVWQETAGKQALFKTPLPCSSSPPWESFLGWQERVKEGNLVIANLPLLARYQECVIFII